MGASLPLEPTTAFDRDLAALLQERCPQPILPIRRGIWVLTGHHAGEQAAIDTLSRRPHQAVSKTYL